MRKRVVIAGFGDTGLLTAIHLSNDFDIVGISPKPCLVSGQELGARLTQPDNWKTNYLVPFKRYKNLANVTTLQGLISHIDPVTQIVTVNLIDGSQQHEHYDALLIASGVSNGFWRNNHLENTEAINTAIDQRAKQLATANNIAIIGGGATGVSVASNLAEQNPDKQVHLFYSQSQPLPGYHPTARKKLEYQLQQQGVHLHPQHRAFIPENFNCDELTSNPISWQTGQADFHPDLCLWAIGKTLPNNDFIPKPMLNDQGFVLADEYLRVPEFDNVFTVGDIAATDPNRSSARNWGFRLASHNIRAYLQGKKHKMKPYTASDYRWGSIAGIQKEGLRVYQPDGKSFRFSPWAVRVILFPLLVRKMIYKGMLKR